MHEQDIVKRYRKAAEYCDHGYPNGLGDSYPTPASCGRCKVLIEAADEIERLRAAGDRLKQALLVTSNAWGRWHTSEEDAKYHLMVDKAIAMWKEDKNA